MNITPEELLRGLHWHVERQKTLGITHSYGVSDEIIAELQSANIPIMKDDRPRFPASRSRETLPPARAPGDSPLPEIAADEANRQLDAMNTNEVAGCERCKLCKGRTRTVFGSGNRQAELMFVGEGPGYDEDMSGLPFVGKAGQLLTKIIEAMGISREDVYIANVVKCRPPENRRPDPDEVAACMPFLERQIQLIRPRFICALGNAPANALLANTAAMRDLRGRFYPYRYGIEIMPTYHPAYLLRNPSAKRLVWEDIQTLMARMGLRETTS